MPITFLRNLPIFQKLFLSFVVLTSGIIIFAALFYSKHMTDILRKSAAQETRAGLTILVENLEHKLHDVETLLLYFESSPVVEKLLEAPEKELFFLRPDVEKQFLMLGKALYGFEDLRLFDGRGREQVVINQNKRLRTYASIKEYDQNDTFQRETASIYEKLYSLPPRSIIASRLFKTDGGSNLLFGIAKMDTDTGGFGGVITARVNLSGYLEDLSDFKIFGKSLLWVLDTNHNPLYSPSQGDMSHLTYITSPKESLPENMLVLQDSVKFGSDKVDLFHLAVVLSPAMFSGQTQGVLKRTLFISMAVLAFAICLAYFISRQFSQPIKNLVRSIIQIRRGNLQVKASEDVGGEIGLLSKAFNEMTETLQNTMVSRELYQSQSEFLNQIMESIPYPFYVIDINNYLVIMANSAAGEADSWKSLTCHALIYQNSQPCENSGRPCPISLLREKKTSIVVEHVYTDENGNIKYREVHAHPVFDGEGRLVQMVEYLLDITERKKAQEDLKTAHAQMLQQEKMASIGVLSAGVAHEINNPVGFISSNLGSLKKYVQRLIEYLNMVAPAGKAAEKEEKRPDFAELRKKLKIDYISADIFDLIDESLEGTERVAKIVRDLKSFSRVDESEQKEADINECLDSTLNIVWNELKYKTEVHKEYGDLPTITCFPQKLNQVFMNLLINAAQAIETKGVVTIKTWTEDGDIKVSIADTGCGIPEEKLNSIFEPFFTTKDVGEGTGLVLSITYDIVKAHHGDISVESKVGEGTVFTVSLPMISG